MFVSKKRYNLVLLDLVNARADLNRSNKLIQKMKHSVSPTKFDDVLAAIIAIDVPKMRKAEIKRRLNEIIADYK